MPLCFFASDLHGKPPRYEKLLAQIKKDKPAVVLLGGDLLPHGFGIKTGYDDFSVTSCFQDF